MSRSLAERLRRQADDEGFGLVEIMVAMTIFAIVALATAPMLIGGLQAGRAAQLNLQGKALAQERLELMRNLPFHVARQNGQYLDVLDIYFRDTQPTGALAANDTCDTRSYDSVTATYSCGINDLGADYPGFRQVVRATFLNFERATVRPQTNPAYDSQVSAADSPASTLLGVAVTTTWSQGAKQSSYTLRSQLANAQADPSSLKMQLDLTAVGVTSSLAGGDVVEFKGGLLSGQGSLTTGSDASLTAVGARGGLASGAEATGSTLSLSAPGDAAGNPSAGGPKKLNSSCALICFNLTDIRGDRAVAIVSGLPQVSKEADPVSSVLSKSGDNQYLGFSYRNASSTELDPALRLSSAAPMVSAGLEDAAGDVLSSRGYLDAKGTGAAVVRSSGRVSVPMVQLFPTDFAPMGLVQISLTEASISCASGGGSGSVAATWSGTVRYWQQTGRNAVTGLPTGDYVSQTLAPGGSQLPAPATRAVLKVLPGEPGYEIAPDANGLRPADVPLSRWVQSWEALTDPASAIESASRVATGTVNAVVSVITAPTRVVSAIPDPTSTLNLAVGTLKCHAEDNR